MPSRRLRAGVPAAAAIALAVTCLLACGGSQAFGLAAPGWQITGRTYPTDLPPGGKGNLKLLLYNIGSEPSSGSIVVTDTLPTGMKALAAGADRFDSEILNERWNCEGTGTRVVTCTSGLMEALGGSLEPLSVGVGEIEAVGIEVEVEPGASGGQNQVTVSGGGAPNPASSGDSLTVSEAEPQFGFANVDGWFSNADGTIDTQAGSHPYELTVAFDLNTENSRIVPAGGEVKNIFVNAPPGVLGNPTALPQCTRQQFDAKRCSPDSQIGVDTASIGEEEDAFPVYNLVPPPGVAAQFGFTLVGIETLLDARVRSGSDYGITVDTDNVAQRSITSNSTTLWGVPEDESHRLQRKGAGCQGGNCASGARPQPFLTLPTSCDGLQAFTIEANSWNAEIPMARGSFTLHDAGGTPAGFSGCDHLGFAPTIDVAPDTSFADTPAGLTVDIKAPQEGLANTEGVATSNIADTTVTLPQGLAINPGQAAGLVACQAGEDAVGTEGAPTCPGASRVGTDEIETPLLAHTLKGSVYILQSNPPDLRLLIAASGEGVNLKLVGDVRLDEAIGRLTATFRETPELPFIDFKLAFSGGAQAALSTPVACGTYTTTSDFTPWSSPFTQDVLPSSSFAVLAGPSGSACPSATLPYTPQLTAGSTTDQAGGYTDFSLLLQTPDDQQRTTRLQFKTPEGLLGMLSKVTLCTNAQAEANACPQSSQIGHTPVAAGPGPEPLAIPQPGQEPAPIYLTETYAGAPFGLSIVVPLHVGPFTLPTQRVRARIEVDPLTAQLTVTTDPLPQLVAGVPADLRSIDAVIDRPGFMFNPTGCTARSFAGTAFGVEGAQAPIATRFQMGSCKALSFAPNFKASSSAHTSRAGGASLSVKLVYPTGALGSNQASSQSNIRSVEVKLPKKLPSRLTTLQKACTAAQFNANPAGCPAASVVGNATARTPVLPVPLTGPAYFVSNGGEAFPNLIVVLQGYGVTVHLIGDTFISKLGITSSSFKQVPDVPIASFALNLPAGPHSALAANGNLCKAKLQMPTHFVAQNGAELQRSTPITVTGCPKTRKAEKAKRSSKAKHGKGATRSAKPTTRARRGA